jgi:hypothetical protein
VLVEGVVVDLAAATKRLVDERLRQLLVEHAVRAACSRTGMLLELGPAAQRMPRVSRWSII